MKVRKLLCLLLVMSLLVAIASACNSGGGNTGSGSTGTTSSGGTSSSSTSGTTDSGAAAAGTDRDFYEFNYYTNYDWYEIKPWGEDAASASWNEKFNINMKISKPDSNPDEKLNLMISSGDLPDAIWMERGANNIKMARLGMFVDLDTLKPMISGNYYDDNILPSTQELLKIDGKLYGIPNWARKGASGGNEGWMYTQEIYEAAGSPELKTFEDLYAYAQNVRDNVPTTSAGLNTIPFSTQESNNATYPVGAFYRALGGAIQGAGNSQFYNRVDGKYQLIYRDPVYKEAVMEANKWYREGLLSQTIFTNTQQQWLEQLTNARVGLIWYDHSQDDGNNFRRIVRETYPGNSIELIKVEEGGNTYMFLPAKGLPYEKIYGYHDGTVGWNVTCITTKAKKPERIFELFSYLLTKQGSIEMMYGPQGDLWDEVDSNGNPILKTAVDDLPVEEVNRLGLWFWALAGHSDNVDLTKFAVNDALPEEKRNWVVTQQAHLFTPLKNPLTDEHTGVQDVIEPGSDLAITRTLCQDYMEAQLPKIVMASTAEEAERLYDEVIAFCDSNNLKATEEAMDVKYQANLAIQGGTIFNR